MMEQKVWNYAKADDTGWEMERNKVQKADYASRGVMVIYSQRLAGYLMLRGFYLVAIRPNIKNPGKNCYLFFESSMLKDAMENYINKINKE